MYIIREFNHKLIEVSPFKISIQWLKSWITEVQFWVSNLKTIENTKKSNMKMG